jgi:hypothetical protein
MRVLPLTPKSPLLAAISRRLTLAEVELAEDNGSAWIIDQSRPNHGWSRG